MASVTFDVVSKRYGDVTAVHDLDLTIADGEFMVLLGPSGCGKTTALRAIAGFERPDDGQVLIDGRDVTDTPPSKRDMGMVFQAYSLFPHLTVLDNVAFGLKLRGKSRTARRQRGAARR